MDGGLRSTLSTNLYLHAQRRDPAHRSHAIEIITFHLKGHRIERRVVQGAPGQRNRHPEVDRGVDASGDPQAPATSAEQQSGRVVTAAARIQSARADEQHPSGATAAQLEAEAFACKKLRTD